MSKARDQSLQRNLMPDWEESPTIDTALPADFKANGFWQLEGQKRAGTLRREGLGAPLGYFIVSHQAGQVPFTEPTEVTFETRHGLFVTCRVMEYRLSKDAGGQAVCSEYDHWGERCQKSRFWKTYCKEHTLAKGFQVTDDGRICMGRKQDGTCCRNKAKVNGYCAQHGKGSAPREKTTRLYEFPVQIINFTGG